MPVIDTFPDTVPALLTRSLLNFIFDLLPATAGSLRRQIWIPRLKVDGTEVQIRGSAKVSQAESSIGPSVSVTLLKDDDRALFTENAVIEFGIGRTVLGAWDEPNFKILIEDGRAVDIGYSVEGEPQSMNDNSTVTIMSSTANRLNKTSLTGLIIYDSNRVTITSSDLKPIDGPSGLMYPEVVGIPNLKLSDLFSRVFVTECGFDSYKTNIPVDDYPIERYQVTLGSRFYDGLKGFIGMYRPAVDPIGNDLWITDTTTTHPTGFPDPKEITIDRPLSIRTQSSRQQLDGLLVQYVGLTNNYDFTTFRFDYANESKGNVETNTETITVEFRKSGPLGSTIVREAKNIENRRTLVGGVEVDNTSEVTEFTSNGWPAHIRKTTQKLLPPISDPTLDPVLQNAMTEKEEYVYLPHPFRAQTQYVARRSYIAEGIISTDTSNPLPNGAPYRRDLLTAHRSGNVTAGQSFVTGPIKSREESMVPLRNGQVSIRTREVDEISNVVVTDRIVEKPGDVGISGVSSTQMELLVLAPGVTTRSSDFIDTFPVGELPKRYFEPLAQRVILQRQSGDGTVSLPVIGYDESLRKGIPVKVGDRDGNSLGNYLIVGLEIDIDASGLITTLTGRKTPGSDEPLQQLPAYARTAESGEVLVFTVPILCTAGYTLRVEQGSVSNVLIEARHVGDSFVNIETTELDLTPWDGTTEDFEIRITVGTISSHVRVQFDVNVDLAI